MQWGHNFFLGLSGAPGPLPPSLTVWDRLSLPRAFRSRHLQVISMSLGGPFSASLNSAVAAAFGKGTVVVVSAGNDDDDACSKTPASAPEGIVFRSCVAVSPL